ncbi:ABC transporter ATP-binding protein [Nodosilinea sp. P-1105]|uniref:ABC transporter ATP-binding protein n=1 Tax=Nodosilinea sp. P-1105 TaxID=2546229 RepID=UPI00146DE5F2|nr:ABC transporter ATP-binding protein [Nodosilinea sp. P-1105]NMF82477.1 ABC transporter ATP-binding protein [Nodosilinea sp. P-1105]
MSDPPVSPATTAIAMIDITKRFPGVVANQGVNFAVQGGEIHGLLGENGAGKTTLMNILCGLYRPDQGQIQLQGRPVQFHRPADAIAAGIGMVHQHFQLVERFTVAENLVLGERKQLWRDNPKRLHQRLRQLASRYGLDLDPAMPVWQLSVGQQQRVEILKALYRQARVLILDEPTAVLTPQETQGLIATLQQLAAQGTSIIFISHKLNEVLAVCDRITVLRDGQTMGTVAAADCDTHRLAEMMVGREVDFTRPERASRDRPEPRLRLEAVSVQGHHQRPALDAISLTVHSGEIVGIAGVDGNGQRELEEVIVGLRPPNQGTIHSQGTLAHIPSDRYTMGLIGAFSVTENLLLRDYRYPPFQRRGMLRPKVMAQQAMTLVNDYLVRTPSVQTPSRQLSGGNAQKVVIARELSRQPQVILAAQPTRGLDVGAIDYVHAQLMAQRDAGAAILLISTELDEILRLCDRIAVLYEGQIVGWANAATANVNHLGLMMAGKHPPETLSIPMAHDR